MSEKNWKTGLVLKSTGSWYHVKDLKNNKIYQCIIKGQFRQHGIKSTNPVAVGDIIAFLPEDQKKGVIQKIQERKNYIIRKSSNLSKQSHIIAANIDQAILVVTLVKPQIKIEFVDRYLLTAEAYRIPALLIFNKTDIYNAEHEKTLEYLVNIYQLAGYTCISASIKEGKNLQEIEKKLKGKTSLLSGNSGVGKTTIINSLVPGAKLKTSEISGYHKMGKHTTTFAEMISLPFGGYIIDTPGIKGFGLVNIQKEELSHFFPEIFEKSNKCDFYNCTHIHEPGCAVIEAVEKGYIAESRYNSYYNVFMEETEKYRK